MSTTTKANPQPFQAEVERLLNMVTNAMYSDREVFLRELISNAADACDRLRYTALQKPDLLKGGAEFAITITANKKDRTLIIQDNGIGMSRNDMAK
ncbi:MAG: molecular chaperone HtpG, partial [Pseudomonadota bacterium]